MSDSHVRQLHLNVNILHSGFVPSAWRLAESDPAAFVDVQHYVNVARIAESAKFDAVFLADNAAIGDHGLELIRAIAAKKGGAPVLVTADGKVVKIHNADAVDAKFYGKAVTISGKVDGDSVHIDKISE